jgi:periplasmic nitrate reductase NapD
MTTDPPAMHHISSALVRTQPDRQAAVVAAITGIEGCEVAHAEAGKVIVIIEGPSSGAVGSLLTQIALLDHVVSANLVYEQAEPIAILGEPV